MAAPKKSRKPRASTPKNQYSAELSSGQLVMGITILMVFGLACFLLGVVIGKIDPSLSSPLNVAQEPVQSTASVPTTAPPTQVVPPMQQKTVTAKRPQKRPVKPAPSLPKTAPITTDPTPAPPAPAPKNTLKKPPAPITPPPSPIAKRGWSVQAGAFKIKANAQREKERIQARISHSIDIIKPPGSIYHKLLIGSYPSESAAKKLKKELTTKNPNLAFGISKPI